LKSDQPIEFTEESVLEEFKHACIFKKELISNRMQNKKCKWPFIYRDNRPCRTQIHIDIKKTELDCIINLINIERKCKEILLKSTESDKLIAILWLGMTIKGKFKDHLQIIPKIDSQTIENLLLSTNVNNEFYQSCGFNEINNLDLYKFKKWYLRAFESITTFPITDIIVFEFRLHPFIEVGDCVFKWKIMMRGKDCIIWVML